MLRSEKRTAAVAAAAGEAVWRLLLTPLTPLAASLPVLFRRGSLSTTTTSRALKTRGGSSCWYKECLCSLSANSPRPMLLLLFLLLVLVIVETVVSTATFGSCRCSRVRGLAFILKRSYGKGGLSRDDEDVVVAVVEVAEAFDVVEAGEVVEAVEMVEAVDEVEAIEAVETEVNDMHGDDDDDDSDDRSTGMCSSAPYCRGVCCGKSG